MSDLVMGSLVTLAVLRGLDLLALAAGALFLVLASVVSGVVVRVTGYDLFRW